MHFRLLLSLLVILGLVRVAAAQSAAPASSGTGSGAVELPGQVQARFVLDGARYAMAIDRSGSQHVPKANEKLLVVEFTVENIDERQRPFALSDLRLSAIDTDSRFGEALYADTTDRRLLGTDRPAGDRLLPGQNRKVYQGIFVNANSTIDTLLVRASGGDEVRIPIASRIAPLPAELAGPDGGLPEMIPAVPGRRYVVGAYDLTADAVERQAIGTNPKQDQLIVPLSIHNRLDEDWKLDRGLIPAYVTDADGERHELKAMLKRESDTVANLRLAPGQTVTVRLQFVVPKEFKPAQVALFSRSGRGQSHRLLYNLGPLVTIGRVGNVLGKYEPLAGSGTSGPSTGSIIMPPPTRTVEVSGTSTGTTSGTVGTPESTSSGTSPRPPLATTTTTVPPEVDFGEVAARQEAEIFGTTPTTATTTSSGIPQPVAGFPTTTTSTGTIAIDSPSNQPLTFPDGRSTSTTTTSSSEAPAENPAPLPAPVRHAVFDLQTMLITRQHENQGDEYYLVTYPFRGLRGAGDRIYVFDAVRQIRRILPGENWARDNSTFQVPADVGRLEFRDLKPYEVYGFVAVVMEADGNTEAEQAAAFGWGEFQNEDGVLEVLADLFDRAVPRSGARPAYEDRTCEVVAEVDRLNRLGIATHFGTTARTGTTAKAIQAALATPMKRPDPDDFDGWFYGFYANLPGDESCFPDGHVSSGGWYPNPGPIQYSTNSVRIRGEHRLYER